MPPRVRNRATKTLKENIGASGNKLKSTKSTAKGPRKALADKTNSVSDDNISDEIPTKSKKVLTDAKNDVRPRRDRRLPPRFIGNEVLDRLSNSKERNIASPNTEKSNITQSSKQNVTPAEKSNTKKGFKDTLVTNTEKSSPFKTPAKTDTSLTEQRPRRICRLPSRFEDHSISPHRYIPIQPANASTPIQPTNNKSTIISKKDANKSPVKKDPTVLVAKVPKVVVQKQLNISAKQTSPDTNNNAKSRTRQVKRVVNTRTQKNTNIGKPSKTAIANKSQEVSESQEALKTPSPRQTRQKRQVNSKKAVNKSTSFEISVQSTEDLRPELPISRPKRKIISKKPANESSSFELSPESRRALNTPKTNKATPTTVHNEKKALKQSSIIEALSKQKSKRILKPNSPKKVSPKPKKRILPHNLSYKVLEHKRTSPANETNDDFDIYEFTFDPNEEPKPQKKKRKRPATNKPSKPRTAYKSAYERNINRALNDLKNNMKPSKTGVVPNLNDKNIQEVSVAITVNKVPATGNIVDANTSNINNHQNVTEGNASKNSVHGGNYPSIRVEDIAADIEPTMMDDNNLCYSPVYSPEPRSPVEPHQTPNNDNINSDMPVTNKDPLNLQEDLSFFDDIPVASSSMNASVRHPLASPWRVEFGSLPIKWRVNAYVKPNMTPAVESSFISTEDTVTKKHVYTNIVPETTEPLPQIFSNTPNYKQTSIISFIREQAEKSAKKKAKRLSSPKKSNTLFKDITISEKDTNVHKNKQSKQTSNENVLQNVSSSTNDTSNDKENSKEERETRKRRNNENICGLPAKSPRKQKDKDCTYFGFDESGNQDSENVSPVKINLRTKSLRPRTRPALQEINGPSRAVLPIAAKSIVASSSDAVNKVYEELKSAADAPEFPDNNVTGNVTTVEDPTFNDDSQSVHLFEDIEVVHHLKPTRKSYGKAAKKVTFRKGSTSDSDTQEAIVHAAHDSSYEDDLADLTFEMPNIKEKKKTKKKKKLRSKKEEKEAEEWAAGFNSMCDDIEEFPLVIE